MVGDRAAAKDIGLAVAMILVCAAFLWESLNIRSVATGDPVGPAGVARITAFIIIALSVYLLVQAVPRVTKSPAEREDLKEGGERGLVLWVLGLTVLYVLGLGYRIDFAVLTALFLFLSVGILGNFSRRTIVIAIVIAIVMAYGCQYLFTQVFLVDLP